MDGVLIKSNSFFRKKVSRVFVFYEGFEKLCTFMFINPTSNMDTSYDLIVVGTGPGGYVAAIRASQLGLKTAVVERESLGGVCLNWGCIPTKALLKSADLFDQLSHAKDYGLEAKELRADFRAIIDRSRGVAQGMSQGITFLMKKNNITVIKGEARLVDKGTLEVRDAQAKAQSYKASHLILATGARSRELPQLPIDGQRVIGYREAMTLKKQPRHLLVIGSGAIGIEFAYFYHTIGTKVEVVEALDRILPQEDADVSSYMEKHFKKKGMKIHTHAQLESIQKIKGGLEAQIKSPKGQLQKIKCDVILSAVGISPNVEGLGLEQLNIGMEKGKVKVDEYYQTTQPGVYAIGDLVHGPALAHVASAEGIICVEKIAGKEPLALDYKNLPGCTYCQPEVASVGYTEEEAKAAGYSIRIGMFPFTASGKAKAAGHPEGFVKLIYEEKYGELLGAHMIGAHVTEMIAEIVTARKLETTGHEILKTVHPHPTLSEAVMEATAAAYGEVIHL